MRSQPREDTAPEGEPLPEGEGRSKGPSSKGGRGLGVGVRSQGVSTGEEKGGRGEAASPWESHGQVGKRRQRFGTEGLGWL